jgi:ParB-like chromosome segregation protein Spo0J
MTLWPADKIERRPIDALVPYARNARLHSDEQVAQIAASIREWGWTIPVLTDESGTIIAGHGRVLAAYKLGLDDVPCMTAVGWSEAKRRAYVLADNKLTLNATWDDALLKVELDDLAAEGFDLDLIGFSEIELTTLRLDKEYGENDADAEWQGMPEFDQEDQMAFRDIVIHFRNEDDVADFARLVGQKISPQTKFLWHPQNEVQVYRDKRWATGEDADAA